MIHLDDQKTLATHLEKLWPGLDEVTKLKLEQYRQLIIADPQNLTRLIDPLDFVIGHLLDVKALIESGLLEYPAMDLGSGVGVPGVVAALMGSGNWILAESEKSKAEFLNRAVNLLHLGNVEVHGERGEVVLLKKSVQSVVARAVGPVSRIFGWIGPCSTWNNIILFKGPKWVQERSEFINTPLSRKLRISESEYHIGYGYGPRFIVKFSRVPRGTG